jgi:hypothetical protein
MTAFAAKWQPVSDIDSGFGSISYSFQNDALMVRMVGVRSLVLHFSGVVAFRFEQECPGFEPLPHPLPMLAPSQTFPLLVIKGAEWSEQFDLIYKGRRHFALISYGHLVQLIANPEVHAHWEKKP